MAEITFSEWVVLRCLNNAGGSLPGRRFSDRDRAGWPTVKRLEAKGKVKISHDSHGNSIVSITDAGRAALRSTSYKQREAESSGGMYG